MLCGGTWKVTPLWNAWTKDDDDLNSGKVSDGQEQASHSCNPDLLGALEYGSLPPNVLDAACE
jgi:hypothetical protein